MSKYPMKNRFVAFIDVLGFSKIVQTTDRAAIIMETLEDVKNETMKLAEEAELEELKITWFSDSIVLSNEAETIFDLEILLEIIKGTQAKLLVEGIPLRGGIALGECYHNDNILFGKGMIEAYELESKHAVTPRILISNGVLKFINDQNEIENKRDEYNFEFELTNSDEDYVSAMTEYYGEKVTTSMHIYKSLIKKDKDEFYFINYLGDFFDDMIHENSEEDGPYDKYKFLSQSLYDALVHPVHQLIRTGLKDPKMGVVLKYLWLKDYYNGVIKTTKYKMSQEYIAEWLNKLLLK